MEGHRRRELEEMKVSFASEEYVAARKAFVQKSNPTSTPVHLSYPLPTVRFTASPASCVQLCVCPVRVQPCVRQCVRQCVHLCVQLCVQL